MSTYVLDTDIASLLQNGHPIVVRHVHALPPETPFVTTIITLLGVGVALLARLFGVQLGDRSSS